jgi:hypothetical protein
MSIIAKKPESNFIPAPAGTFAAVCVDVIDLGLMANQFRPESAPQPKIRVVWQLAERMPEGRPYLVSRMYTLSLHDRSTLRQHIEAWVGPLSAAQLEGFDVETLIGRASLLSIVQTERDGTVFANVDSVLRLPKNMPVPVIDGEYVRKIDRPAAGKPRGTPARNGQTVRSAPRRHDRVNSDEPTDDEAERAVLDRDAYEQDQELLS